MALTEQTRWFFGVLDDFQIEARRTRVILDGTDVVAEKHFRFVVEPDQDVSTLPPRVQFVCTRLFTPQVIADYKAAKAAREAEARR